MIRSLAPHERIANEAARELRRRRVIDEEARQILATAAAYDAGTTAAAEEHLRSEPTGDDNL